MRLLRIWMGALVVAAATARADVRVVGSDVLGAPLRTALEAFAKERETPLVIDLAGSRPGREALEKGDAAVGLLTLGAGDPPLAAPLYAVPLAYLVAVVAVSSDVPLEQVTYQQLAGVFGAQETASFARWSELGVRGELGPRAIVPQILADGRSLAPELFRYTVLKAPQLRSSVVQHADWDAALRRLGSDQGAILILPAAPPAASRGKTLLVARETGGTAYAPTPEAVHAGDYPLRAPVQLVFRRERAAELMLVLRFLLSEEAATAFEQGSVLPLPVTVRNQQIFDLEVL